MNSSTLLQKYKNICKDLTSFFDEAESQAIARIIIEQTSGLPIHSVILNPNLIATNTQLAKIDEYVKLVKQNMPIQYIVGIAHFCDLKLNVNPSVLIPRPETEELVEWIIADNIIEAPTILDIGTGSGCIAIALAKRMPKSKVFALDISPKAIEVAKQNATENHVDITFLLADILSLSNQFDSVQFDIVVSNPPYIRQSEKAMMLPNVLDFEPESALFVPDGNPLVFYKAIAAFSKTYLKTNGKLYFEINEALGKETCDTIADIGFKNIELRKDINGKDRMVKGVKEE